MSEGTVEPASNPVRAPTFATIEGVEVVTIPARHYAELLACQRRDTAAQRRRAPATLKSRSRIDNDPEVADFLATSVGQMFLYEAVAACQERFGVERTPSRSAIDRYWRHLRRFGS